MSRALPPPPRPTYQELNQANCAPQRRRTTQPVNAELCAKTLSSLGLEDPALALLCAPSGFIDCTTAKRSIAELGEDEPAMLYLRKTGQVWGYDAKNNEVKPHPFPSLYDAPWPTHWRHVHKLRVELADDRGRLVYLTLFGGAGLRDKDPQAMMLIHGSLKTFGNMVFLQKAEHIPIQACGHVYPRYKTPGSTTNEAGVRAIVTQALNMMPDSAYACTTDLVRKTLLSESQMLKIAAHAAARHHHRQGEAPITAPASLAELLHWMHEPPSMAHAWMALACAKAIAVEGIRHAARQANERPPHPKSPIALTPQIIQQVLQALPEKLTQDQQEAIDAICTALQQPSPLTGLLSGDVGTGKTLTFAVPTIAAHLAGAKTCILSPTELLANQAYEGIKRRFPFARIERVLTGKRIQDPQAVLVGTAGLCTAAQKANYHPDFLVIDEQHKLSTKIRSALCHPWTHILEASATPIPRSLAASLFAGMAVFTLRKSPVKRDIRSHLLTESQRSAIVKSLRQVIADGARAAFIYPRVHTDSQSVRSVTQVMEMLQEYFPGKVCGLHGKMSSDELKTSLESFRCGITPIVVSSSVMETGIDVADIRLLVVRDAENFGAAQLHQLRGRLARNGGSADFYMLVKEGGLSEETRMRLQMVCDTTDGYALAEADMKQRGFGDLNGDAQSGACLSPIRLLHIDAVDILPHLGRWPPLLSGKEGDSY